MSTPTSTALIAFLEYRLGPPDGTPESWAVRQMVLDPKTVPVGLSLAVAISARQRAAALLAEFHEVCRSQATSLPLAPIHPTLDQGRGLMLAKRIRDTFQPVPPKPERQRRRRPGNQNSVRFPLVLEIGMDDRTIVDLGLLAEEVKELLPKLANLFKAMLRTQAYAGRILPPPERASLTLRLPESFRERDPNPRGKLSRKQIREEARKLFQRRVVGVDLVDGLWYVTVLDSKKQDVRYRVQLDGFKRLVFLPVD